jgi:hypothetical protein
MLRIFECEALEEFPVGVSNLVALEELYIARCRALERPGKLWQLDETENIEHVRM